MKRNDKNPFKGSVALIGQATGHRGSRAWNMFDGPEGLAAVRFLDRMVKEGGMPVLTKSNGEQAFVAGKIGFAFQTTGALRNVINNVGEKFDLRGSDPAAVP